MTEYPFPISGRDVVAGACYGAPMSPAELVSLGGISTVEAVSEALRLADLCGRLASIVAWVLDNPGQFLPDHAHAIAMVAVNDIRAMDSRGDQS